jgi:oligopeptide/dipeptide ABC transporter ATP-binding protein
MRQRVMIAMAIACRPKVLIADEPTTALDVTIQAQILDLIKRIRHEHGTAVIFITHDLGVVADIADMVAVMYGGRIVEYGPCADVFRDPQHPYTWGLLSSSPRVGHVRRRKFRSIPGSPPSALDVFEGCRFRPRCMAAYDRCAETPPLARRADSEFHLDACWLSRSDKRARRASVIDPERDA